MNQSPASFQLYRFDGVDEALDLLPLSARRALDHAGKKLALVAWRSLRLPERQRLCQLGQAPQVDTAGVVTLLGNAAPAPEQLEPQGDPDPAQPPAPLLSALGAERPLPDATWSALSPLDRYALVKVAGRGNPDRLAAAYQEIVGHSALVTHLAPDGSARMVGISSKAISHRRAVARSRVALNEAAFERLQAGDAPKGDVLGTARLAGIMAAKRTSELIPLCHPISLSNLTIAFELDAERRQVQIEASAEALDRTGVEMEAMVAASVSALTIYDMLKAFDRGCVVGPTLLVAKSGGRSGDYRSETGEAAS